MNSKVAAYVGTTAVGNEIPLPGVNAQTKVEYLFALAERLGVVRITNEGSNSVYTRDSKLGWKHSFI